MPDIELETSLRQRWVALRRALDQSCQAVARRPDEVAVLPVSKSFSTDLVRAGQALGWTRFGENRVQEIRDKESVLGAAAPDWVLIGNLQSNKVKQASVMISEWQSLERLDLAQQMDGYLQKAGRSIDVLLQLHTAAEAQKHGLPLAQLETVLEGLRSLPTLRVQGLMTVATQTDDASEVRRCFSVLRHAREQAQQYLGQALPRLSMGMSGDFGLAIAEGSTELRIGSALFGGRLAAV